MGKLCADGVISEGAGLQSKTFVYKAMSAVTATWPPPLVTDRFYSGLRGFLFQPRFFVYSNAILETP